MSIIYFVNLNLKKLFQDQNFLRVVKKLLPIFFVGLMLYFAITSFKTKSFTIDEGNYLYNGEILAQNLNWDNYITRFHPPLTFYYHGLLTRFNVLKPNQDKLYAARLMMMPILVLFSLAVFIVARSKYGYWAGLLTLVLFCFDPNILAHGRLITPDLTLAFFIFLFLTSFYLFLTTDNYIILKSMISGIILGLALLTKYNGLMLIFLSFFFFLFYHLYKFLKKQNINLKKIIGLIYIYVIAILVVNAGYFFNSSFILPEEFKTRIFNQLTASEPTSLLLRIFPGIYLTGVDYQIFESQRHFYWMFFAGQRVSQGMWYFFPLSFLIKVPIPFLTLLIFTFIAFFIKKIKFGFFEFYLIASSFFFFIYFSFFNKLIIGFRYILMIFPLLFVIVSQLTKIKFIKKSSYQIHRAVLLIIFGYFLWGTIKIHPHYLAYVNEFVGGPKNAYKYYADSNLDWGQNWRLLHQFKKTNTGPWADDPKKPTAGKIIVSVNSYNLFYYEDYQWLRQLNKEPADNIGYTWLIFDITEKDLEKINNDKK
jgi:hypothetical protein